MFQPNDYDLNNEYRNRKEAQASNMRQIVEVQSVKTKKSVNIVRVVSQILVALK